MVLIEEVDDSQPIIEEATMSEADRELSPSEEKILDAVEIEAAAEAMKRPSARAHLEALAKKLRRDGAALKRVEESRKQMESASISKETPKTEEATTPSKKLAPPVAPVVITKPVVSDSAKFVSIDRFSFDAGGYNSQFVTLYIPLVDVGSIPKDQISCPFKKDSFDLIVNGLNGKNYRLCKNNLEKDIVPEKSKYIVKADKIVIKLAKVKGEYGSYDSWMGLTAKKTKKEKQASKDNPNTAIMDLMKDMYDSGDDQMKKMIGETMLKQREGKLDNKMDMGDGLGSDL